MGPGFAVRTILQTHLQSAGPSQALPSASLTEVRPDQTVLDTILVALEEIKAEDVVTIDLFGKTSIADHMVVASGRSHRQVASLADNVLKRLKETHDLRGLNTEGMTHGDWVLIDAGDVIVHIFRPEVREFYNIEKMWSADRPADGAGRDTLS